MSSFLQKYTCNGHKGERMQTLSLKISNVRVFASSNGTIVFVQLF